MVHFGVLMRAWTNIRNFNVFMLYDNIYHVERDPVISDFPSPDHTDKDYSKLCFKNQNEHESLKFM